MSVPCHSGTVQYNGGRVYGPCSTEKSLRLEALFGQDFVDVLAGNAGNQFIPHSDSVCEKMDGLRSSLLELSLPSLMACPGGIRAHMFVDKGVMSSQVVRKVTTQVCEKICAALKDQPAANPWLDSAQVPQMRKVSRQLGLRLGVWEKKLTPISRLCQKLYDMRTVDSLLCGDPLQVFGWAPDDAQMKAAVCSMTLQRAREAQLPDDAKKLALSHRFWHTPETANEFFTEVFLCPHEGTRYPIAPSLFSLIQWKSREQNPDEPTLKWRDVVSYKNHVLQSYSRIISWNLQVTCQCFYDSTLGLGFPMLLGVRDQVGLETRLRGHNDRVEFRESDMNGMIREIPKEEAMAAIRWAMTTVRAKTRGRKARFSIAQGGEKDLDRAGSCSPVIFTCCPNMKFLRFGDFDLHCNTLLHLGSVMLSQGSKGVPIGDFLSAQIAERWAAWHGFRSFISSEAHVLQKRVQSDLDNVPPLQSFVQARGSHFSGPGVPQVIDSHPEV